MTSGGATDDTSPLLVLVDGGGTGCRARLCDLSGTVIAKAEGEPANVTTDFDGARENIADVLAQLYRAAGRLPRNHPTDLALLGLAGAGVRDIAEKMEHCLDFARARVCTDRDIMVVGALGDSDGTVAMLGTGSFFASRRGEQMQLIGGRGFQLGDDCSGAWLGRSLLRATIRALDGIQPQSPLTTDIAEQFGSSAIGLVEFAQSAQPADYAAFAPQLAQAARSGDATGVVILTAGLRRLCQILDALDVAMGGALYLLGGLAPLYRELLPPHYQKLCKTPRGDEFDGALTLARRYVISDGKNRPE